MHRAASCVAVCYWKRPNCYCARAPGFRSKRRGRCCCAKVGASSSAVGRTRLLFFCGGSKGGSYPRPERKTREPSKIRLGSYVETRGTSFDVTTQPKRPYELFAIWRFVTNVPPRMRSRPPGRRAPPRSRRRQRACGARSPATPRAATETGQRPGRPRDLGGVAAPKPRGRGPRPIDDPGGVAAPGPGRPRGTHLHVQGAGGSISPVGV